MIGLLLAGGAVAAPTPPDWRPKPVLAPDGATVVELTLKRCLIAEAETDPLPLRGEDTQKCERLNRATLVTREDGLKRLRLKPGRYVFRVRNADVPWTLDFAVRGAHDKGLPATSGGAIKLGEVFDFPMTLTAGIYVFGSPLNGTLDYALLVED
ncbi:MAG: hypothetical protein R3F60_08820 [bacterium]